MKHLHYSTTKNLESSRLTLAIQSLGDTLPSNASIQWPVGMRNNSRDDAGADQTAPRRLLRQRPTAHTGTPYNMARFHGFLMSCTA